ncbi:MAG: response regulator transcription factor [Ezakiella sp.]|nr:response regulator transcription factor [Ezakiella sp.]MDD7471209.1 response regulator transcription factor [Bacillota bacterium]MDY3923346.1 response regulator transcription factor [Ezakiella sp.]
MRLIVVDDDKIVVKSLTTILKSKGFDVVGEANDGKEALEIYKKLHPDMVLMDIRMESYDGIWATENIINHDKDAKILLLTTFSEKNYIKMAIKKGARGYILKDNFDDLAPAIEMVNTGKYVFDPDVYKIAINVKDINEPASLTNRELEVLKLIGDGFTNREIGEKLFLSEGTIRNYVSSIFLKTGTKDRTELAVKYLKGELL